MEKSSKRLGNPLPFLYWIGGSITRAARNNSSLNFAALHLSCLQTQPRHFRVRGFFPRDQCIYMVWCRTEIINRLTPQRTGCFCGIVVAQETFTMNSDQAQQRAERNLKKEERAQDGRKAMTEYEVQARATREKTARLKALRFS